MGGGEKPGHKGGVSVEEAPPSAPSADKPDVLVQATAQATGTEPIGTSHFESKARMTVPRGTSAMVSILDTDTAGEVVYYYDAETPRGNATYPFRAVKVANPTDYVLEQGPVTVFGEGKFIGEGMCEPIPARSTAFIPFALDRQIVVERKDADVDHIARILTVQRGVFSTEVQHTRRSHLRPQQPPGRARHGLRAPHRRRGLPAHQGARPRASASAPRTSSASTSRRAARPSSSSRSRRPSSRAPTPLAGRHGAW